MKASRQSAFTIIEIVVILMIIGILAAFTVPRLFTTNVFEARGYYDYVVNTVRYAQKTAVAQRRLVYVKMNTGTGQVSLCFADHAAVACTVQVPKPTGETPYTVDAPSGVALSLSPSLTNNTMFFDGRGRPYDSADAVPTEISSTSTFGTLTVTITGGEATRTFTVEKESGHVHS